MSSHHIVRDDQEPALIIANGEVCSSELLGQLLEWSPIVIVLDSAIERVLELEIKVDVLLGDFDRGFDASYYKEKQYPLEIVYAPNQDKTDLEKAFDYLIEKGHKAVNVIWATGKRADHTITNLTNIVAYRNLLKIVILDDHSKVYLLPETFDNKPKYSLCKIFKHFSKSCNLKSSCLNVFSKFSLFISVLSVPVSNFTSRSYTMCSVLKTAIA